MLETSELIDELMRRMKADMLTFDEIRSLTETVNLEFAYMTDMLEQHEREQNGYRC